MARETIAAKARRYLVEGRVILTRAAPGWVVAQVRGEGAVYTTGYHAGRWACTCPAHGDRCAHIGALKRISAPDIENQTRKEQPW